MMRSARAKRALGVLACVGLVIAAFAAGRAYALSRSADMEILRPISGKIDRVDTSHYAICVVERGGRQTCSTLLRGRREPAVQVGQDVTGVLVRVRQSPDVRGEFIILTGVSR